MYSLKSYCVQIARHAELVHGCGIKWTLTLSGIVLKDVATVHRNGMKNTAATARTTRTKKCAGRRSGKVIFQNVLHAPVLSRAAASYTSVEIACRPAR